MPSNSAPSTRTFRRPPTETEEPKPPKKEKRPRRRLKFKLRLAWLLVVVLLAFSIFMVWEYHRAKQKVQTAAPANASQQVSDVTDKVGKLIILPAGETPTVATVVHADKLRSQSFFMHAHDGDRVLVYAKAKQAYLYRPSSNKLVNVAPVTTSASGTTQIGQ